MNLNLKFSRCTIQWCLKEIFHWILLFRLYAFQDLVNMCTGTLRHASFGAVIQERFAILVGKLTWCSDSIYMVLVHAWLVKGHLLISSLNIDSSNGFERHACWCLESSFVHYLSLLVLYLFIASFCTILNTKKRSWQLHIHGLRVELWRICWKQSFAGCLPRITGQGWLDRPEGTTSWRYKESN